MTSELIAQPTGKYIGFVFDGTAGHMYIVPATYPTPITLSELDNKLKSFPADTIQVSVRVSDRKLKTRVTAGRGIRWTTLVNPKLGLFGGHFIPFPEIARIIKANWPDLVPDRCAIRPADPELSQMIYSALVSYGNKRQLDVGLVNWMPRV